MSKSFAGIISALAAAAAVTAGAVATAAPAGAATHVIRKPTLTVVCTEPHHGNYYSAVRFRQHGRAFAGSVVVTLANGSGAHAKAEMHKRTGTYGFFRLHRMLHSSNTGPWVAGTTYSWTTAVYADTAATARRGTVTLTGSC